MAKDIGRTAAVAPVVYGAGEAKPAASAQPAEPTKPAAPASFDVVMRMPKGGKPAGTIIGTFIPAVGISADVAELMIRSHKTEFRAK